MINLTYIYVRASNFNLGLGNRTPLAPVKKDTEWLARRRKGQDRKAPLIKS